jgi:cell division protein FtsI (penicillin-binding protein 3)
MQENKMIHYRSAILLILFIGIFFLFLIFLINFAQKLSDDEEMENKIATIENKSLRGQIISADGFVVAHSKKMFRAEVNARSIDPKKKELFIKLFSIYSGISEEILKEKFYNKAGKLIRGHVVLTDDLDYRLASDLKSLAYKMHKLKIFRPLNRDKPHIVYGLDILPSSEERYFPHKDIMTPVVGYIRKREKKYRRAYGIKGLEKEYDEYLVGEQNGFVKGQSDVLKTPILTGESVSKIRKDGFNLHLNIELAFQKNVEAILDKMKKQIDADEVMAAVMDSKTGAVLALASSERFNPERIRKKDIKALDPHFSEYLYEPGSVIKPLTMAIALDKNRVDLSKQIRLGGKLKVTNSHTISDDEYYEALTPKGIIMFSSNIGISKIAWKLSGQELYNGWRRFGLAQYSGVDLSKENTGRIKPAYKFNHKTHSSNTAYGYGLMSNFMQLLKAYSAFNNNGIAVTPQIVKYLSDNKGQHYVPYSEHTSFRACSSKTANIINDMLQATVNRGTGTAAQYDGLEVGGKTGTAHVTEKKAYVEKYHSSFFGFANDKKGHKYTIGVFMIKPRKVYFASQTAAPTFEKIVGEMVEQNYLVVDKALARQHYAKRKELRAKKKAAYLRKIEAYNKKHGIK